MVQGGGVILCSLHVELQLYVVLGALIVLVHLFSLRYFPFEGVKNILHAFRAEEALRAYGPLHRLASAASGTADSASSPVLSSTPSTSALSVAAPASGTPVASADAPLLASASSAAASVSAADVRVPAPRRRQLRLFLQRVPCAAKTPLYWELDAKEPLGTALKGKVCLMKALERPELLLLSFSVDV